MTADRDPPPTTVDDTGLGRDAGMAVRRAPFSDNPRVGARGQRTQQRILDASLQVFGERGYHQCSIDRITRLAGCSRVSFYQYFSSKEDLFRHLTGQVARQLSASAEALDSLTPDAAGWATVRAWVGRHAAIYDRYRPVFQAFQAAAESDELVAGGSVRTTERNVARLRSRLATTSLPTRQLDPVIALLMECLTRTFTDASVLRSVSPDAYPTDQVQEALADVVHRTFFGRQADVNVHTVPRPSPPPTISFGTVMQEVLAADETESTLTPAAQETFEALLRAGREVFVRRGYHRARIDDVVEAAGLSHGAFYRYFKNKDDLAHVVAVRAMRSVSSAFGDIPDPRPTDGGSVPDPALTTWLRRYNAAHAPEAAVVRVWADASLHDPRLSTDSAAVLDWGRRRMARFLARRGFGDVDTDAVVMVALLSAFGSRERPTASIDAAAYIVERGLLGR